MQRWIEIEEWRRTAGSAHPSEIAQHFGWTAETGTGAIGRDADVEIEIVRPNRITQADLGLVPPDWLSVLAIALQPGERFAQQRLCIARVPRHTVHYRLGAAEERVAFLGRRFLPPPPDVLTALKQRASNLHWFGILLFAISLCAILVSLSRGLFYWSVPTLFSFGFLAIALITLHSAIADRSGTRGRTRRRLVGSGIAFSIAVAFVIAGLPRLSHARTLIAAGKLVQAERELRALGDRANAGTWADLQLARIAQTTEIEVAKKSLAAIPRGLTQNALATAAVDHLILQSAQNDRARGRLAEAATTLAQISEGARGQPDTIATASSLYTDLAREQIDRGNWTNAGRALESARTMGVPNGDLEPLSEAIHRKAIRLEKEAVKEGDPRKRLRLRQSAEETFVAWARASNQHGTPSLIALRVAMAHDVTTLEKAARRRAR